MTVWCVHLDDPDVEDDNISAVDCLSLCVEDIIDTQTKTNKGKHHVDQLQPVQDSKGILQFSLECCRRECKKLKHKQFKMIECWQIYVMFLDKLETRLTFMTFIYNEYKICIHLLLVFF